MRKLSIYCAIAPLPNLIGLGDCSADEVAECKQASEAIAPAQSAWVVCTQSPGSNQCGEEANQLFEIAISAIERCGPSGAGQICEHLAFAID